MKLWWICFGNFKELCKLEKQANKHNSYKSNFTFGTILSLYLDGVYNVMAKGKPH